MAALQIGAPIHQRLVFPLEGVAEFIHHASGEQRLGHKGVHAGFPCLVGDVVPVERREDDDRRVVPFDGPNLAGGFNAVHLRHAPVDQDQVIFRSARVAELYLFDAFKAGLRGIAADAELPQYDLGVLQRNRIIIDHKHAHLARVQSAVVDAATPAGGFAQRDGHGERRALALLALHFDMAVHQFHDALGDRHAEAGAAVTAGNGGILLAERVEEVRQVFLAHADTGIGYDEPDRGLMVVSRPLFDHEPHEAAFRRELDGVGQYVYHHLLELHRVADIVIVNRAAGDAFVPQPLVPALAAHDGIDLFQALGKGKFLCLDDHFSGFDARHVQYVVDDSQQVLRGGADLCQILPDLVRSGRLVHGDVVQSDDRVHGRADLMAHVGEERGLRPVGLLRRGQRFAQNMVLLEGLPGFGIHIGKTQSNRVHLAVVPVLRMANAGKADHDIDCPALFVDLIAIRDHALLPQPFPDGVGIRKLQEIFAILIGHGIPRVRPDALHIGKVLADFEIPFLAGFLIADPLVLVQMDEIDAPIIRTERCDQLVLQLAAVLLLQ